MGVANVSPNLTIIESLTKLREYGGSARTTGLPDETILHFARKDSRLPEAVDAALRAEVPLEGGARMWIEPTRALVAVDVDTGGDTSPAAALKANLAMARELPRQLRLRGLGGQVAVDAAPMPKGQRRQVDHALKTAFRRDPIETALVGWTPLGHIELQRKRERLPLAECLPEGLE